MTCDPMLWNACLHLSRNFHTNDQQSSMQFCHHVFYVTPILVNKFFQVFPNEEVQRILEWWFHRPQYWGTMFSPSTKKMWWDDVGPMPQNGLVLHCTERIYYSEHHLVAYLQLSMEQLLTEIHNIQGQWDTGGNVQVRVMVLEDQENSVTVHTQMFGKLMCITAWLLCYHI